MHEFGKAVEKNNEINVLICQFLSKVLPRVSEKSIFVIDKQTRNRLLVYHQEGV